MDRAPMLAFGAMFCVVLALAWATAWYGVGGIVDSGDFRGVAVSGTAIVLVYAYGILVHRVFLSIVPLEEGIIVAGSRREFHYRVYLLFYVVLFNTLIRGRLLPSPVIRLIYLALGARLGPNTYSAGTIFDPMYVTIGANCIVGDGAALVPHVIERGDLGLYGIAVGNNVTIGAHAIILAGVTIGDDVIVAANSVVPKNTRINNGETWGGTPARRLNRGEMVREA